MPRRRTKTKQNTPLQGPSYGKFKCETCNRKWQSDESWANKTQKCRKCGVEIYPHKLHKQAINKDSSVDNVGDQLARMSIKKKPKEKKPTTESQKDPLFGEFKCQKCKKYWKSANSWKDYGQECKRCHRSVFPDPNTLRPLEPSETIIENRREHPQELCAKCGELGFYCRENRLRKLR